MLGQVFVKPKTTSEKSSHHRHLSIPKLSNPVNCIKPVITIPENLQLEKTAGTQRFIPQSVNYMTHKGLLTYYRKFYRCKLFLLKTNDFD